MVLSACGAPPPCDQAPEAQNRAREPEAPVSAHRSRLPKGPPGGTR
jgi:hypothetical protein